MLVAGLKKMMFFLILVLSLFSNSFAQVGSKKIICQSNFWKISNKLEEVCYDDSLNAHFSKSCFESSCFAKKIKNMAKSIELSIDEKNPNQNPGAIVCDKLKGKVVIGRNLRGSEIAFCKATDGSLVDLASLGL